VSAAIRRQPGRWPALAAGAISGAVFGLWLGIAVIQESVTTGETLRYVFIGAMLLALPVLAVAGSLTISPTRRLTLLAAAASGMLIWGILALFSVGLLLIVAAVLAWTSVVLAARAVGDRAPAALAAVAMFALPVAYVVTL
jgi:hypothetical protein